LSELFEALAGATLPAAPSRLSRRGSAARHTSLLLHFPPPIMLFMRRKGRVLVLDDDVAMQKLVSLLLKRSGYRVDVVAQGNQAIEAIAREEYDAILLDLMMPHEGGITVLKHLRDYQAPLLKRVLLVTGAPESILRSVREEVFGIVSKPFGESELTSAVDSLVAGNDPDARPGS
jgi:CheY-like chemotaxis protein